MTNCNFYRVCYISSTNNCLSKVCISKKTKGFTYLELLIVISILFVISFIAIPVYKNISSNYSAHSAALIFASNVKRQIETAKKLEKNAAIRIENNKSYYLYNYQDSSQIFQNLEGSGTNIALNPPQSLPYTFSFTPNGEIADPQDLANSDTRSDPTSLPLPEFVSGKTTYQVLILRDPVDVNTTSKTVTIRKK